MQTNLAKKYFEDKYPLIKLFSYEYGKYLIYDARMGFSFIIEDSEISLLIDYLEGKLNEGELSDKDRKNLQVFETLKNNQILISGDNRKISPESINDLSNLLSDWNRNIAILRFCLEVTEECSLRCTYCRNTYSATGRKHSFNRMNEEIAFRSLDFYFKRYTEILNRVPQEKRDKFLKLSPPAISWYGGEPFMNFNLIRSSLNYLKKLPWERYGINIADAAFVTTSNFTVVNDDIIEWLIENNIRLAISIDGDRTEHNKNRVFKNGVGSFDIIYKNIEKLFSRSRAYFMKNVTLNAVMAENVDYDKAKLFFENDPLLSLVRVTWLPVGYDGVMINRSEISSEQSLRITNERNKKIIDEIIEEDRESGMYNYILDRYGDLTNRFTPGSLIPENYSYGLFCCPIGYGNIMTDVYGRFHMCNKTDGTSPVGDYNSGIKDELVIETLKRLNSSVNDNCRECWAYRFCSYCSAQRLIDGHFLNPEKNECSFFREVMYFKLDEYIYMLKTKPHLAGNIKEDYNKTTHPGIVDIRKI